MLWLMRVLWTAVENTQSDTRYRKKIIVVLILSHCIGLAKSNNMVSKIYNNKTYRLRRYTSRAIPVMNLPPLANIGCLPICHSPFAVGCPLQSTLFRSCNIALSHTDRYFNTWNSIHLEWSVFEHWTTRWIETAYTCQTLIHCSYGYIFLSQDHSQ
jgi:hypothetical protein